MSGPPGVASRAHRCVVCGAAARGTALCAACGRSYDRTAHREGTTLEVMAWSAGRARRAQAGELRALRAERDRLRAALEGLASPGHGDCDHCDCCDDASESAERALRGGGE